MSVLTPLEELTQREIAEGRQATVGVVAKVEEKIKEEVQTIVHKVEDKVKAEFHAVVDAIKSKV